MKNIPLKSILYFIVAILIFSSCSKMPDQTKLIPNDAAFVGVIDVVSLAQKGKLDDAKNMQMFKSAVDYLRNTSENSALVFESLLKDPDKSGIDIFSDVYLYSVMQESKSFYCITAKLDDKDKFQGIMEELLNDDYDLIKGDNYTYYSNETNSWIAFDNNSAVFISSIDSSQEAAVEFIDRIFTQEKSETIASSKEFGEFYENKKDISFWLSSTQIIAGLESSFKKEIEKTLEDVDGLSLTDLENNYIDLYIDFEDNTILFDFSLQPNEAFKTYLESTSFSKDKLGEEVFTYFPQNSYFFVTYAFDPQKLHNYLGNFNEYKELALFLQLQGIDIKEAPAAIGGDCMLSIYNLSLDVVEKNKTILVKDAKGMYSYVDTLVQEEQLIPKGSFVMSLKNETFFHKIITQTISPDSYTKVDSYYDFTKSIGFPLYVGVHNNMLMLTTDNNAMSQLYDGGYAESFSMSELSQEIESPTFYYLNLDYDTYPIQLQEYVKKIGVQSYVQPYLSAFKSLVISSNEDFSGQMKITMKSDKENSLYQVLGLMNQNFNKQ